MATPARVKLTLNTTEFTKGMARMTAAMKRFGASIPRVHSLDPASPVYDRLLLDHLMRTKADALLAEAQTAPFVRRFYLRAVARKLRSRAESLPRRELVGR